MKIEHSRIIDIFSEAISDELNLAKKDGIQSVSLSDSDGDSKMTVTTNTGKVLTIHYSTSQHSKIAEVDADKLEIQPVPNVDHETPIKETVVTREDIIGGERYHDHHQRFFRTFDERNSLILSLFEKKMTNDAIAKQVGITEQAVYHVLRKAAEDGKVDLSTRPIVLRSKKDRKRMYHHDKEKLYADIVMCYNNGRKMSEIVKMLKVGRETVEKAIELHTNPDK